MDAFIHLAAFKAAGESMIVPEKYSINNINGTINLLNAAMDCGVKEWFSPLPLQYMVSQNISVDESHPVEPQNYYGFTKLEIERFLQWYERLKGLRFAALRYFNAAGYDIEQKYTVWSETPRIFFLWSWKPRLVSGHNYPSLEMITIQKTVPVSVTMYMLTIWRMLMLDHWST